MQQGTDRTCNCAAELESTHNRVDSTLQLELLDRRSWPTRQALANAIFEYIEAWYNPRRRHSTLELLSPVQYEQMHASLALA
jgi:putative transposase